MNGSFDSSWAKDPTCAVGLGLRSDYYEPVEQEKPDIGWFEILVDNYLNKGGAGRDHLQRIAASYPLSFHGVGMSLGSTDPLNRTYFSHLKHLVDAYQPVLVSDHLCWTGVDGTNTHELLPLPYIEEAVRHLGQRIQQVQDYLGRQILIENVSSYLTWEASTMTEWEFVCLVAEEADCAILLDINNVYVSACNHGFEPRAYLAGLPAQRIAEYHLAGYEQREGYLLDSHGGPVRESVWGLYDSALQLIGPRPTLIEWDNNLPAFARLLGEAHKARERLGEHYAQIA